jgi:dUTP pyrophosphatase
MFSDDNVEIINKNIYMNYSQQIRDSKQENIAFLKIFIENEELRELYKTHIKKHNEKILHNDFLDSGFDLFCPNDFTFETQFKTEFLDMQIKTEMFIIENERYYPVGFFTFPRSSISKTPLIVANGTGIIDCGYRGNLIGAFRSFESNYNVVKHTRLLQIVYSMKTPIYVVMVENLNDLSSTERNTGGFGSTGK